MVARQDNENLYLIYSDDLIHWDSCNLLMAPKYLWEFVQIGNCDSPIELDEGWLLFTHGVGPVRRYSIGATLLDKHDPSKVIGRSVEPLLRPEPEEREGYVPNVVYTCGAMRLFLPGWSLCTMPGGSASSVLLPISPSGRPSCDIYRQSGRSVGWSMPRHRSPGRKQCSPTCHATPIGSQSRTAD